MSARKNPNAAANAAIAAKLAAQPAAAKLAPAAAPAAAPEVAAIGSATLIAVIGAKQFIRRLLSMPGASLTLDEICKASGKSAVNVRTMLSDLRSPKYAGKSGIFSTVGIKKADGKTYYEQVLPPVSK